MSKKKSLHRQSVETLNLSDNDDERIIAEITELINGHQKQQPYSRNVLLLIKDLLERNGI